jgi:lipoprotein-releasing system permease protein
MLNKIQSLIPKWIRFEFQVALRHLISGGWQTLLTVGSVAAGVIIVIFVTGLIFGMQKSITSVLTSSIAHVTITAPDPKPIPLDQIIDAGNSELTSTKSEQQAPQAKNISDWNEVLEIVKDIPNVKVAASAINGQGFLSKGANPLGVTVVGADPYLQDQITPVSNNLLDGRYQGLLSDEIVIEKQTAKDMNVSVGDRVLLSSDQGSAVSLRIVGIYSFGQQGKSVYITLRTAQSLFGLGASVNTIFIKVNDIFTADAVADRIIPLIPYKTESWSRQNPTFLSTLSSMAAIAYFLSGISLLASSFAIASILIVSVLQKQKQIGILKSMGAKRIQIQIIFILEGLGVAIVGSLFGASFGSSLIYGLSLITVPGTRFGSKPEQLIPVAILPNYIVIAILAAILSTLLAAYIPARRAASLNPVDVMR